MFHQLWQQQLIVAPTNYQGDTVIDNTNKHIIMMNIVVIRQLSLVIDSSTNKTIGDIVMNNTNKRRCEHCYY